jgi:hypothetical protein
LYLWEMVGGIWKNRKSFPIRSKKAANAIRDMLTKFEARLP